MLSLADLLKNHPVPGIKEAAIREDCVDILTKALGVSISVRKIKYESGVLTLSVPPVVKSAALLKQAELATLFLERGLALKEIR